MEIEAWHAIVGWVAVKIMEWVATAKRSVLTEAEAHYLKDLHKMHSKTNEDGTPLWYVSPIIEKKQDHIIETVQKIQLEVMQLQLNQKEIVKMQHDIAITQRETMKVLEMLADRLR